MFGRGKKEKETSSCVMSGYAEAFERVLKENKLVYRTNVDDDGDCIIRLPYTLDPNLNVTVTVVFDKSETIIRFFVYNYISAVPGDSVPQVLEKLNELNFRTTFYKFYIDNDRDIVCSWFFPHMSKDLPFSPINLRLFMSRVIDFLDKNHDELYELSFGRPFNRTKREEP